MPLAPEQVVTANYSSAQGEGGSAPDITPIVTTAVIPAGRVIIFAVNRGAFSTSTNGISDFTTSGGSIGTPVQLAASSRASTHDICLFAIPVASQIPAGSTIAAVHRTINNAGRRGVVFSVWNNVSAVANATSGTISDNVLGDTTIGASGSSSPQVVSTLGPTTAGPRLLVGAFSLAGSQVFSSPPDWSLIGSAKTNIGTSDRGVALAFALDEEPGIKSVTAPFDPSGSWAAALAALPGTFVVSPPSLTVTTTEHILASVVMSSAGGTLSINQTSGPSGTPVLMSQDVWLLPRHASDTRTYTVTGVFEDVSTTQIVTVPSVSSSSEVSSTSENVEYLYRSGGAWV